MNEAPAQFEYTAAALYEWLKNIEGIEGITLSGGEPFEQAGDCALVAKAALENGLNVWVYTGYTFEQLLSMADRDGDVDNLLKHTEILVDGPFGLEHKNMELKWRGSSNQRLIDVKKSFDSGFAVEFLC